MPITDKQRFDLHAALRRVLGEELGDVMIEHLPPVGWADVALSRDVAAVRSDIDSLRRDVNDLKNDVNNLKSDIRAVRSDMDVLRHELREELHRELSGIRTSIRVLTGAMITIAAAMLGVMVQINVSIAQL